MRSNVYWCEKTECSPGIKRPLSQKAMQIDLDLTESKGNKWTGKIEPVSESIEYRKPEEGIYA